jgi:hypothetical protein
MTRPVARVGCLPCRSDATADRAQWEQTGKLDVVISRSTPFPLIPVGLGDVAPYLVDWVASSTAMRARAPLERTDNIGKESHFEVRCVRRSDDEHVVTLEVSDRVTTGRTTSCSRPKAIASNV